MLDQRGNAFFYHKLCNNVLMYNNRLKNNPTQK
jgi:hypothetical protein